MKTVLITEDEEILREIFRDELTDAGYSVIVAKTGKECLELVSKQQVDLVIMDVKLPDITGLELLGKIREINTKVPLMMCTAYDSFQNDYQVWSAGIKPDEYLLKPIDLEDLRAKVKNIIG